MYADIRKGAGGKRRDNQPKAGKDGQELDAYSLSVS